MKNNSYSLYFYHSLSADKLVWKCFRGGRNNYQRSQDSLVGQLQVLETREENPLKYTAEDESIIPGEREAHSCVHWKLVIILFVFCPNPLNSPSL